jgi:hypothetical protein
MNFLTYEENVILSLQCCGSAAFFDGNADRDPTLHFDADPDPDLTQSFTHIGEIVSRRRILMRLSAQVSKFVNVFIEAS